MAPVIQAMGNSAHYTPILCSTEQHQDLIPPLLDFFDLSPHHSLPPFPSSTDTYPPANLREYGLSAFVAHCLYYLPNIMKEVVPDMVLVQGDTNSALAGAMTAFHQKIPVGHVEAGLRSGDMAAPWPEEGNRRLISVLANIHFAPTTAAATNLQHEAISPSLIHVTGNTGIDALLYAQAKLQKNTPPLPIPITPSLRDKRQILVTIHRRENQGTPLQHICDALRLIADRQDCYIILPLHPNPDVASPLRQMLGSHHNMLSHLPRRIASSDYRILLDIRS